MATKTQSDQGGIDSNTPRSASKSLEERLQKQLDTALYCGGNPAAQKVRNFLNGTWIGEPLHVILTDIPIGAWTVALLFDTVELMTERSEFALAADASLAIGLAGATGAAMAGVTDWSDVDPPARRTGLIHGLLNLTATALFGTSLVLRRKNSRTAGRVSAMFGYGVMMAAAHLGGRMVYECRVGVDRTAGQAFPKKFVAIMPETELSESKLTRTEHDGVPILLVRKGSRIYALAETCSHFSGPLSEGKLVGDTVVCPYHASRFALDGGRVIDGPAVHPQPCLETRIRDGQIEVRTR